MQEEMREDPEQMGDVGTDVMGLLGESGMCVCVRMCGRTKRTSMPNNRQLRQSIGNLDRN